MGKKNIRIPVDSIIEIKKEKTAKLIPNAIAIKTHHERHVFASLVSRDRAYLLLMNIWRQKRQQEDEDSLNGSSQNGERNDGIDDCSDSVEDNVPSNSDDSQYFDNKAISGGGGEGGGAMSVEDVDSPDVIRRCRGNNMSEQLPGRDVATNAGRKSEPLIMQATQEIHPAPWHFKVPHIPSVSSTTIILFLTTVLIVCLILSAGMLALRVIQLQAQMEATLLTSSASDLKEFLSDSDSNDQVSEDLYHLRHSQHLSNIQRLHTLLEVHLRLLEKVNQSLKTLRHSTAKTCSDLPLEAECASESNSP